MASTYRFSAAEGRGSGVLRGGDGPEVGWLVGVDIGLGDLDAVLSAVAAGTCCFGGGVVVSRTVSVATD
jgi:hypothetical protein